MNPGSSEAVAAGCLCPPIDNHFGVGRVTSDPDAPRQFVRSWSCPMHGCTCLADWRSGERVRNPGCNIHGDPTPKEGTPCSLS